MFPAVLYSQILLPGSPPSFQSLNYSAVSVILAAILLSYRNAFIFTVLSLGFMALLPLLSPARIPGYTVIMTPLILNLICSVLAIVFRSHREKIEKFRQTELRQSRDAYKLLVENMPDFVLRFNRGRQCVFSSENIQKTGSLLEHAASLDMTLDSVFEKGKEQSLEYSQKSPFGVTDFSAVCRPEKNSAGEVVSVLVVSRDMTEKKRLETRLRQSEKMQAIGQLAGGIAHDFNNQLAGILGYADLLWNDLSVPALRGYADMIRQSAQKASGLTRQLLTFSRKGTPVTDPVEIHSVILEVVGLLTRSIDKKIVVNKRLSAKKSTVLGDASLLQSSLLNLGINARDAIADSGEIRFETSEVEFDSMSCRDLGIEHPPGSFLMITVSDTGRGMDKSIQQHLFEPFFTTKPEGRGTGLGLSIVYGTVRSHRGAITVYSEPGHGSTFKIFLPVVGQEEYQAETPDLEEDKFGGGRILVVEDEASLRTMIETILVKSGYSVVSFPDGNEALMHYSVHWKEIDLVVLDLIMPVMGGKETFLKMKEINPGVKAVLSSGFSLNGEAKFLLDAGAMGFIQKPYTTRDIRRMVKSCLGKKQQLPGDMSAAI